jgi:hypothetical protein
MDIVTLLTNPQLEVSKVETLDVADWDHFGWTAIHQVGLSRICAKYQVRYLCFSHNDDEAGGPLSKLLSAEGSGKEYVYLHNLQSVQIELISDDPSIYELIRRSRIKSIRWDIYRDTIVEAISLAGCNLSWLQNYDMLKSNFSLREVKMIWSGGGYEFDCYEVFKREPVRKYLDNILANNQRSWKQCQVVSMIVLAMGRQKKKHGVSLLFPLLGRDVWTMISQMVWDTRGTIIWAGCNE